MVATLPLDGTDQRTAKPEGDEPTTQRVTARNAGLDLLRTVACVLVVAFHMRTVLGVDFGPLNPFVQGGDSGVYIFFALSGYLLYRPFLRGDVDLRIYGLKRAARLIPGYFVALVALAIITGSRLPVDHPLPYVSMTAPYNVALRGFLGNAWTLSAEILFYVSLPLIARYARGAEIPRLAILALVSVVANLVYAATFEPINAWFVGAFPIVFYAFVPGMLLAVIDVRDPALFRRFASPLVAVGGLVAVASQMLVHGGFPIALGPGVGAVLLIGWLASVKVPFARPLAFAGGASYALYLWHKDMFLSFGVVGLVVAIAGAAASWMLVERPMLNWAHAIARMQRSTRGSTGHLESAKLVPAQVDVPIEGTAPVSLQ